jgi:hypothetical protein
VRSIGAVEGVEGIEEGSGTFSGITAPALSRQQGARPMRLRPIGGACGIGGKREEVPA